LGSIEAWYVPLDETGSAYDLHATDRLQLSVEDHVSEALESSGQTALPVETTRSGGDSGVLYIAASVALPDGKAIEQRFRATPQRIWRPAHVQPLGPIDLVRADGKVIRSFAPDQSEASSSERHSGHRVDAAQATSSALIDQGPAPPHASAHQQASANERHYWPFIVGGALAVVAPFLSWVHVVILGSLNQFQLLNAGHASELWALFPLGLGLCAAIEGEHRGRRAARVVLLAGIAIVAADGLMLIALEHDVRQTYGLASTGFGPWVGVAGGIMLAVGGGRNLLARAS
jgi:hypothetical protein